MDKKFPIKKFHGSKSPQKLLWSGQLMSFFFKHEKYIIFQI